MKDAQYRKALASHVGGLLSAASSYLALYRTRHGRIGAKPEGQALSSVLWGARAMLRLDMDDADRDRLFGRLVKIVQEHGLVPSILGPAGGHIQS